MTIFQQKRLEYLKKAAEEGNWVRLSKEDCALFAESMIREKPQCEHDYCAIDPRDPMSRFCGICGDRISLAKLMSEGIYK